MPTTTKPRRRWFQFRLRTLLVLMLLACIGMSWFAMKMRQARRQRAAIVAIQAGGGQVTKWSKYFAPTFQGWQWPSQDARLSRGQHIYENESRAHAWLRWLLGDDFFTHPTQALVTNGMGMEHLAELPHLEILNLTSNKITDTDLAHVKCLPRLQVLYVISNNITDVGVEHLKELRQLDSLYLFGKQLTDAGLEHLEELTQLESLDLSGTQITDAGLDHLRGMSQLAQLTLEETQVSDSGVKKLQVALPNCQISR
jgi:hypothetical protein